MTIKKILKIKLQKSKISIWFRKSSMILNVWMQLCNKKRYQGNGNLDKSQLERITDYLEIIKSDI